MARPNYSPEQWLEIARRHLTERDFQIYEMKYQGVNGKPPMSAKKIAEKLGKDTKPSAVLMSLYRIRLRLESVRESLLYIEIQVVEERPPEEEIRAEYEIPIKRGHEPYDVLDLTVMKAVGWFAEREIEPKEDVVQQLKAIRRGAA